MSTPKGRGLFDEDDDDSRGDDLKRSNKTPNKRQSLSSNSFASFRPHSVGTVKSTLTPSQQRTQKGYASSSLPFKPSVIANPRATSAATQPALSADQSHRKHSNNSTSKPKHMSSNSKASAAPVDNLTFDDSFEDEYDPRKPNDYEQMLEEQAREEQVKKNQAQLKVQMVEQQKQQEQLSYQRKQEALDRIAAGASVHSHMPVSSGMGRGRGRGRGMLVPAWLEAQQREQREVEDGSVRGGLQSDGQSNMGAGNQEVECVVLVLKNVVSGVSALVADVVDDVREECQTHGHVTGIRAIHSESGEIVDLAVLYVRPHSAEAARAALHGRFFAGRQLDARVEPEHVFMQAQPINFQ